MEPAPAPPDPAPPHDLVAAWRTEVGRFRVAERRRVHPLGVHVGVPGGPRSSVEVPWPPTGVDAGLRFDLVAALLTRAAPPASPESPASPAPPASLWLTRPGVPELHDEDLDWHAAAVRAFDAHGVALAGVHAVTRTGWLDVVTGASRSWKRLRLQR